jgi:hypothetical protein
MAGIRDVPLASAVPVGVTTSGQLGVAASSKPFKEAIHPMNAASEAIFALKPPPSVTNKSWIMMASGSLAPWLRAWKR